MTPPYPFAPTRPADDTLRMSEPRGCLGVILNLFGSRGNSAGGAATLPRVMVNKYFVSNAEADFYRVLTRVVGDRGHILAQVSLGQLLWLPPYEVPRLPGFH